MIAVSLQSISKRYGTVQALDSVSVEVEKGTFHAIVGENGAGKTTLMKALYGAMIPDSGAMSVLGQHVQFSSSSDAIAAKVGMVSQHYGIIAELTNLENLILGSETQFLKKSALIARANELAGKMGFEFDWNQESYFLSPAGAQKLEILKLLWKNAEVMILDEPTAMLGPEDATAMFKSLRQLVDSGATILLVTHRLPEVFEYCHRVTILRAGVKVGDHLVKDVTAPQLAQEIVGGDVIERTPPEPKPGKGELLKLQSLNIKGSKGQLAVKDLNLILQKGKLVGIAGVDGSGQRQLFHALMGVSPLQSGSIYLDTKDWTRASTTNRINDGLRIIPEDRHHEAVIEEWSLIENSFLGLQRLMDGQPSREFAGVVADRFSTKHGGLEQPMSSLSGGNQQRFVAARSLEMNPKLILAFQPARGLDLNSTTKVYQGIRRECEKGAAALVVSFDLDELLDFCDEIVVMCNGVLSIPSTRDRAEIGKLMVNA